MLCRLFCVNSQTFTLIVSTLSKQVNDDPPPHKKKNKKNINLQYFTKVVSSGCCINFFFTFKITNYMIEIQENETDWLSVKLS